MGGKRGVAGQGRVWLIGGTRESRDLAVAIAKKRYPCTISVTTEAARALYPPLPELSVWVTRFDADSLSCFLQTEDIAAVVDGSHPFAVKVSRLAIAMAAQAGIPYLRYERPAIDGSEIAGGTQAAGGSPAIVLESVEGLLSGDWLRSQRVLLTIGSRPLPLFQPWQKDAELFARILPAPEALERAFSAGFSADRLIALRPPVSLELERALWQQWNISLVVTKASGAVGGEAIKQQVATELGVPLVAIARPNVDYPQQTSKMAAVLRFCQQHLDENGSGR